MKLFRVELGLTVFVVAETEEQAREEVEDGMDEILQYDSDHITIDFVRDTPTLDLVPLAWRKSIPYGVVQAKTCEELFVEWGVEPAKRT